MAGVVTRGFVWSSRCWRSLPQRLPGRCGASASLHPGNAAGPCWLTTLLVLLVAPQVVLNSLAYLGMAAQRGAWPLRARAAAPAVENLVLILTVVLAGWAMTGRALTSITY